MEQTHKIIAVYGNGGSYKTTTAVALARHIAQIEGDNADVMVIGIDSTKPLIPILFPHNSGKKTIKSSLGKLLSLEHIDQDTIIAETAAADKIGVIAYNACENVNTYAFPAPNHIDDFYMQLRHLVNYTIIDCTSDVTANLLTAKALINADDVVQLVSCDLNGLVFFNSQEPLLQGYQYSYGNYRRVLTLSDSFRQDTNEMSNAVTKIAGIIPHSKKVAEAWNTGRAFEKTSDKYYERAISEIAETLIEKENNDEEDGEVDY